MRHTYYCGIFPRLIFQFVLVLMLLFDPLLTDYISICIIHCMMSVKFVISRHIYIMEQTYVEY